MGGIVFLTEEDYVAFYGSVSRRCYRAGGTGKLSASWGCTGEDFGVCCQSAAALETDIDGLRSSLKIIQCSSGCNPRYSHGSALQFTSETNAVVVEVACPGSASGQGRHASLPRMRRRSGVEHRRFLQHHGFCCMNHLSAWFTAAYTSSGGCASPYKLLY